jgi:hypothetical protein
LEKKHELYIRTNTFETVLLKKEVRKKIFMGKKKKRKIEKKEER